MGHEIDEAWVEEAIQRYQRVEGLLGDFERALTRVDVTVRSPDGMVEIVVGADGSIRAVTISDAAQDMPVRDLSKAVHAAVTAAGDAARWARTKLHQDMFGGFPELAGGALRSDPDRPAPRLDGGRREAEWGGGPDDADRRPLGYEADRRPGR